MAQTNLTLSIDGMHCGSCVRRVTLTLEKLGVDVESVEIGSARLTYDPAKLTSPEIVDAIGKIGFTASEA